MMVRQVNNGFSVGTCQFVSCIGRGVLLPLSMTKDSLSRYFGQARPDKSMQTVSGQR